MSEHSDTVDNSMPGVPLACPKCGSVEFFILATAVVSADVNLYCTEEGEVVAEQFDWDATEIIDDGEEYPLTCTECGHTPRDQDLVVGS